MINWNDLRFFVAVARAGTLAGASRDLKVDQTTVGRRLAALEEALGVQLFARTRDGLSLTPAGERSFEIARDFEERVGSFEAAVCGGDGRLEGTVRVAMNENFSVGFFLERLLRIRQRHPGITLEVTTSQEAVNLLRREADVAIRVAPSSLPEQRALVVRKLGVVALGLYATRGYLDAHTAVDPSDGLAGHDGVFYEREIAEAPPGRWLSEHAGNARPVVIVNSLLGAATAASAGAGLAVIPCFMASKYPSLVRAVADPVVVSDVWLLVHPDLQATARVRAVMDHVIAEMKDAEGIVSGRDLE